MKTRALPRKIAIALASTCCAAALCHTATADDVSDALAAFKTVTQDESAKQKPGNGYTAGYGEVAMQVGFLINNGETDQAISALNNFAGVATAQPVRDAAQKLRDALDARRNAQEKEAKEIADAAIASAGKVLRAAQKPADLDPVLQDLSAAQEKIGSRHSFERDENSPKVKLRAAREFVTRWQDYLASKQGEDTQQTAQILRGLQNSVPDGMMPRSEILATIQQLSPPKKTTPAPGSQSKTPDSPLAAIHEIVDKLKTLDEIPAAIEALDALPGKQQSSAWNDPVGVTKNELNALYQNLLDYRAGLPTQLAGKQALNTSNPQSVDTFNRLRPLRMELFRLIAPRVLGVEGTMAMNAGETLQQYLDRVLAAARRDMDAATIGRVQDFQDMLTGRSTPGSSTAFLRKLLAARNQDAAGQFTPAVVSYLAVLNSGSELVPAKEIGERLEQIKKEHPADYEKGMQISLTEPAATTGGSYYNTSGPLTVPGSTRRIAIPQSSGSSAPGKSPAP